jgi:hypothetical protein
MTTYTAFANDLWLATGTRAHVVETLRAMDAPPRASDLLVFDDGTGAQIDFDLRETEPEPTAPRGPGRPKLGVTAREVTLLPRHWEWLGKQRGGASAALRRMVEEGMKASATSGAGPDAAYRFLSAIAGDRTGFEEAVRALYADDRTRFEALTEPWPIGIRQHAIGLAWGDEAVIADGNG